MFLDVPYKIYDVRNFLTEEEHKVFEKEVINFTVDLDDLKSTLDFLSWSKAVENKFKNKHSENYEKLKKTNFLTYDDYQKLVIINEENPEFINERNYFNFFHPYTKPNFEGTILKNIYIKLFQYFIYDLYGKKIKKNFLGSLVGNINVYPKSSFIIKHTDNQGDAIRLFTALFFINKDWNKDDGSLLRLYDKDEVIDVVPDYNKIILLEGHQFNLTHEVTMNLSDKFRYSIYCPFTNLDYETKLY